MLLAKAWGCLLFWRGGGPERQRLSFFKQLLIGGLAAYALEEFSTPPPSPHFPLEMEKLYGLGQDMSQFKMITS